MTIQCKHFCKWLLVLPIMGVLSACASVGYVSNTTLVENGMASGEKKAGAPKQLGALVLGGKDNKGNIKLVSKQADSKEKPTIFFLKRHKQKFVAETQLFDHTGQKDATFDKSYFSVGMDKKKKRVGLELKFTF